MDRAELAAWLRLLLADGIGPVAARKLLAAFGGPATIFEQDAVALAQVLPTNKVATLLALPPTLDAQVDATLEWLQADRASRRIVALGDAGYPPALLQTEDPPLLLYLMGASLASLDRAIAIVGSRNPTPQGREDARRFGQALAQEGLTVVSGLALGIDGAAHEGALEGAADGMLATVGVVGTGLDRVYPKRHLALAHRIAERGVLVSEYAIGTPPLAENFPKRNRIIAALGEGTLVVEAALESGSLITARCAADLGKEVFAMPGSIHAPQSRGCHALLRQGAKLVETAQDVLEELRALGTPSRAAADASRDDGAARTRSDDARDRDGESGVEVDGGSARAPGNRLLTAIGHAPVTLDALVARTGLPAHALQARLLDLELAGEVARLPGGLFQRMARA